MWVDARELADGSRIDTDLCIIGAGAAGIAIAREWIGAGRAVALLESGGLEPDAATQALREGSATGNVLAAPDTYLTRSRLRYFGGSTNHWGGFCRPLDAIDYEARDWLPDSGWPFGPDTLAPFYQRALALVDGEGFDYALAAKPPRGRAPLALGAPSPIDTALILSAPERFGTRYRDAIRAAPDVTAYLHANAVELTEGRGGVIEGVRAACLGGPQFAVRSRITVLAAGGIENPRLLLASNGVQGSGVGNHHDLVGRFFMDHLALGASRVLFSVPYSQMALYRPRVDRLRRRSLGLLSIAEDTRRREQLMGFTARVRRVRADELEPDEARLLRATLALDQPDAELPPEQPETGFASRLEIIAEPSPNRDSRVALSGERDPLGLPRVALDWRVRPADYASAARSLELLAAALGSHSRGRVRPGVGAARDGLRPRTQGWSHHMGATRMSEDPRRGVVDAQCRVHGTPNLYVAGSSVFPTAGPEGTTTLTLLALALRLSDALKRELDA